MALVLKRLPWPTRRMRVLPTVFAVIRRHPSDSLKVLAAIHSSAPPARMAALKNNRRSLGLKNFDRLLKDLGWMREQFSR